jgi:hypothetical protein
MSLSNRAGREHAQVVLALGVAFFTPTPRNFSSSAWLEAKGLGKKRFLRLAVYPYRLVQLATRTHLLGTT